MRTRPTLLSLLLVIGAVLALPSTAAASEGGYTAKVIYNYCNGADPHFKVKNVAHGWTTANKLTNETWVEQKPGGRNQTWKKVYTWDMARYSFKANGDRHWLTSWRTWNGIGPTGTVSVFASGPFTTRRCSRRKRSTAATLTCNSDASRRGLRCHIACRWRAGK